MVASLLLVVVGRKVAVTLLAGNHLDAGMGNRSVEGNHFVGNRSVGNHFVPGNHFVGLSLMVRW